MDESPLITLSDHDIWALLKSTPVGRLAVAAGGEIDVFPVNYIVDEGTILFRTAPGTKLLELTVNGSVAFEVDGYGEHDGWSVVVKGSAAELEHQQDIDRADGLPLTPWVPTLKYRWVRITPTSISGRHFRRAAEPDRYDL
ncbi:MAG: pyridoxamine 5'-phosphate oxidase family protein [Actinobacteria bacterium]|nr:pyridoxamine 5'-phosphate oxidase family protein [Actinomycetota bacterium]